MIEGPPNFDDGKDAEALRTIGEVSKALGIRTHVLRYWEQRFEALQPLKRSGGRRYYRAQDVRLIQRIDHLLNQEGYTLKGAADRLAEDAHRLRDDDVAGDSPSRGRIRPERSDSRLDGLEAIRARLRDALDASGPDPTSR